MHEKKEIQFLPFSSFKLDDALEDFNCALIEKDNLKGHLLLNNHCLGFVSEDKEKTISFNFNEIKNIILKEEKIEIEHKNEHKINFFSFDDFSYAFDKINSIFKLYIENEAKDKKSSGSDFSDSNNDNEDINKRQSSSKFSLNSSNDTSMSSSKNNCSIKNGKKQNSLNGNKSTKNIKRLSFGKEINEDKAIIRNNSSKKLTIRKKLFLIKSDKSEEKFEKPIIPEKIIFKDIDKNLDHEICKKVIDIPPKEFFEKFQTNKNPETSYAGYYKWVGEYSEIDVGNWEKIKSKKNNDVEKYQRKEKFCLALHGVPLINKSHVEKTCTYWIDKDGTYYMNTLSLSKGVPLADKFNVETNLEFHPYMNNTKTVFRAYVRTNIIKWTLFKMALISQGKKSFSQEIDKWFKFIEEKGNKIIGNYCI